MAQLHEREAPGFESTATIEPAQGEEKERLKRDCTEYLQDPNRTTDLDFLNFTQNMIQLIGGKREKGKGTVVFTSSNPLLDQETQASIVFKVKKSDLDKITVITIEAQFADRLEQLLTVHGNSRNSPSFYQVSSRHSERPPELDSYIIGKRQHALLVMENTDLNPNKAKDFVRRVFDVYTRQGQQVQPPTPQS